MYIIETMLICLTAYSMLSMFLNWKSSGNTPKTFIEALEELLEEYNKRYN